LNSFDDDIELGLFEAPRRRPPRDRERRPQRGGPRRAGPTAGSNAVLRLAGLVAIAIAIVFGLVLACSSQSKGDYSAYIAAMRPLAHDSASVGAKFATALATPGLTLDSFKADLTSWSKQEQDDYVAAQRLQPPGPLQSAHAEALATFYLRGVGLANLASHLALATENHDSPSAAAAVLVGDAQLLSTSDVMWEQLYKLPATQTLTAQNVRGVVVPASKIVTSPDIVSAHSLGIVYQRVGTPTTSGGKVAGIHGTSLTSTSAVENGTATALSTTTPTTVSCCGNLVFDVEFQDTGRYPEVGVKVTLSVTVAGESVYTQTQTVSQIAPGQTASAHFPSVHLPTSAFGHNDAIYVRIAPVRGEKILGNNAATYPVYFLLSH
jgi:hypothetical protein